MAEPSTVARPYAEAVFKLADAAGALPKWSEMLAALAAVAGDARVSAAIAVPGMTAYSAAATARLASPFRPAASRRIATLSVASHVNSGSSRPKWPYAAVFA